MEVFMLSVVLFTTGAEPTYKATIMDNVKVCIEKGEKMTALTHIATESRAAYYYKCVERQGT